MADRLANEAAEECSKGRAFDYDISKDFIEPFKDKFWPQQKLKLQTAEGTTTIKEHVRD